MTIIELLERSDRNRESVAKQLGKTPEALHGIDDLFAYLECTRNTITREPSLQPLAFFVTRAIEDVEVAVVAAFTGMIGVCVDACRDIMEIELLLKDFMLAPDRIADWYAADERERMKTFRPVHLRERQANQQGIAPKDLPDSEDYAKHSASVHVSPDEMLWRRGVTRDPRPWFESDFAAAEILDHAERLLQSLCKLAERLAPGVMEPPDDARDFSLAVKLVRTQFVPRFRQMVDGLQGGTA